MRISTGEELKTLRRLAGWTQHQLGHAAGLSPGRLSLFESGFVGLSDEQKTVLSEILLQAVQTRAAIISKILQDQKFVPADVAGG